MAKYNIQWKNLFYYAVIVMDTWRNVTVAWRDINNFDTPLQCLERDVTVTVPMTVNDRYRYIYCDSNNLLS